MYLKTIFAGVVLSCAAMLFGQSVGVSYNTKARTFNPSVVPLTAQLYPVFCFSMPEGYTDFELKASVTNFIGLVPGIEDKPEDHVGDEVVFYYNSMWPYIGTTPPPTKAAPFQKFNPSLIGVYFQVSKKYASSSWDGRRYIKQTNAGTSELSIDELQYSLYSNLDSPMISKVGGCLVVCGFNPATDTEMAENLKPTNGKLMWTIRFFKLSGGEQDANGNPVYHPIFPITWINSTDNRL